jgi:hypothetical protein
MNRVHFTSERQNWKTPKAFYSELDKEFHFADDPCPTNPRENGLLRAWKSPAFVNPPYNNIKEWVKKGYEESLKGVESIFLIPSRTDTKWWHEFCMRAKEIRFIKGRLHFDDQKNPAPFPSCLVIFGSKI